MLSDKRYEKRFQIVDTKTGEVKYSAPMGYFPPRFDEERGYLFWNQKNHATQFADVDFPEAMSMMDRGRLATLAKRIWANTNCIGKRSRDQEKRFEPCDLDDIAEILGIAPRYAKEWLDRMVKMEVMAVSLVTVGQYTDTHYYINPIYFFSSDRLPLNLYLLFRRQLDKVLPDWVQGRFAEQKQKEDAQKNKAAN
jgi:hypothetical protein